MSQEEILKKTEEFVKSIHENDSSGHDYLHIDRVRKIALIISKKEKADVFIVEMVALLHDVDDYKISTEQDKVKRFLKELNLPNKDSELILDLIKDIGFKGTGKSKPRTIEGLIVQDADRLDAIGAVGIARVFTFGAMIGRQICDSDIGSIKISSFKDYKNNEGTTIGQFYEKLLLLKDLMNTNAAKDMAKKRHEFMEQYLEEFFNEIKCDD